MKPAPILPDDADRCGALRSLDVLDTPQEERFDRLTRLAQQTFGVRIALVSLVDQDRQWFKSVQGLTARQTARSVSFCGHAIAADRVFVVEDASTDDRFADNPLVVGDPCIRFYAGCPLRGPEGHLVGTLCVIDDRPRSFSDANRDSLRDLASLVELELARGKGTTEHPGSKFRQQRPELGRLRLHLSSRVWAAAIALLVGASILLSGLAWNRAEAVRNTAQIQQELQQLAQSLQAAVSLRLGLVRSLAALPGLRPDLSDAAFEVFALQLGGADAAVRGLLLSRSQLPSLTWERAGNRRQLESIVRAASYAAAPRDQRRDVRLGLLGVDDGTTVLIAAQPVPGLSAGPGKDLADWGWAIAVFELADLLTAAGWTSAVPESRLALRVVQEASEPGTLLVGDRALFEGAAQTARVSLPGGTWELALAPATTAEAQIPYGSSVMAAVAAISLLFALLVYNALRQPASMRRSIRRTVDELQLNQSRFRDAIQALPAGIVIFDRNNRLNVCNDRYRSLYANCRPRLQVGRGFEEILRYGVAHGEYAAVPSGDAKAAEDFIEVILNRHHLPSSSYDLKLSNGRWIRVVEQRMRDGGNVSFHVDVTEERENESALVDARHRAEKANQAKSTFLATVSHEVRTPLNGVLGLLHMLGEDASLDESQAHYVRTAHRSAEHLLLLLNEILDISKMEAGKLDLEPGNFRLMDTLDGAIDLIQGQASIKGLAVQSEIDPALNPLWVRADEARLRQIVLNLLSNAVKFTDAGHVRLAAHAVNAEDSDAVLRLEVSVTDTGVGFDPADAQRLFLPFEQLDDDARRRFSGTGLGLSICKRLVELMGGQIRAEGSVGHGACFTVCLDLPRIAADALKQAAAEGAGSHLPKDLGWSSPRILLAEDSPTNQLVIKAMLKDTGYVLDVVGDGEEVLAALQRQPYDLILMDMYMPNLDGMDTTRRIRAGQQFAALPIIALTANAMQGDSERFVAAGMNDYLSKPVNRRLLLDALFRQLRPSHELRRTEETC